MLGYETTVGQSETTSFEFIDYMMNHNITDVAIFKIDHDDKIVKVNIPMSESEIYTQIQIFLEL